MSVIAADLIFALPEVITALGALLTLVVGVFKKNNSLSLTLKMSVFILLCAFGFAFYTPVLSQSLFNGFMIVDAYAIIVKLFILALGALALISVKYALPKEKIDQFEYPVLILLSVLGMMIMVSSFNMLTLFIGLELQSLSLYILTALRRDNVHSSEAGLKYFILGALSSGLLLYGISLIYGFTGTTDFHQLAMVFSKNQAYPIMLYVALTSLIAGLCFKISLVPFHMWAPDVYEGAPTSVVAFLSTLPKIAALAMIARVFAEALGKPLELMRDVLCIIAIASMLVGAFAALFQVNLKRVIAYSSITNMGYAMIGVIINSPQAAHSSLVFVLIYAVTTLGIFATLLRIQHQGFEINKIKDLTGLGRLMPGMAFALAFFLFSLAGIPPLAGFLGKLYIFEAAINGGYLWLAIIGVLTSVVSAAYYLWVIKVAVMDERTEPFSSGQLVEKCPCLTGVIIVLIGALMLFFIKPNMLLSFTSGGAHSLFIGY